MFFILLTFIFLRPFISSLAFPYLDYAYSLLLLGFLLIWILGKRVSADALKPVKFPLIGFILAICASILFSVDKIVSLQESYKYATALLLFCIGLSLGTKERGRLIVCILGAGLLISTLAIYQYFWGFKHVLDYMAKHGLSDAFALDYVGRQRVFFPFATPNILGGYIAMLIPLALINKKTLWIILPLGLALILTKSLGAIAALTLGVIFYLFLQGKVRKKQAIFIFIMLVIFSGVLILRLTAQKAHLHPGFSAFMRIGYWKDTLEIIKTYPLFGVGLGNFNLTHSRYAHNSYLQLAAEIGIPGLLAFFWLIGSILIVKFKNCSDRNYLVGLIASAVVFLLHNFVDFTFFLPEVVLIWWVILGA